MSAEKAHARSIFLPVSNGTYTRLKRQEEPSGRRRVGRHKQSTSQVFLALEKSSAMRLRCATYKCVRYQFLRLPIGRLLLWLSGRRCASSAATLGTRRRPLALRAQSGRSHSGGVAGAPEQRRFSSRALLCWRWCLSSSSFETARLGRYRGTLITNIRRDGRFRRLPRRSPPSKGAAVVYAEGASCAVAPLACLFGRAYSHPELSLSPKRTEHSSFPLLILSLLAVNRRCGGLNVRVHIGRTLYADDAGLMPNDVEPARGPGSS